ncbi:MAG TPA: AAA family ATPase, partial [Protaetiibacter sp.]|nr:AAA family ATPase [Protaetiibacter sp.]
VHVLVCARHGEPISTSDRFVALREATKQHSNVEFSWLIDDDAPQEPEEMPGEFWKWWARTARAVFSHVRGWDALVASESYGAPLAAELGVRFIPYDPPRQLNPARGTQVRQNLREHWPQLLPHIRRSLQLRATFFGPESVGKTTISRRVAELLGASWLPEYARGFLETRGADLTGTAMLDIAAGQEALQRCARRDAERPFLCQDTDLYSTVGYYGILNTAPPRGLLTAARELASDIYYLLPEEVPFEPDPLRFGGDQRESTNEHWREVLRTTHRPWAEVPFADVETMAAWVADDLTARFEAATTSIRSYRR